VWSASTTDVRLKKRIVRTVIHEAIADLDDAAAEIVIAIHWMGGAHTEHRLPRRRRGQRNATSTDIVKAVGILALVACDDVIAGILNRNGLRTGNGNRWTRERVTSLRSYQKIPVYHATEQGAEPWLNLSQAVVVVGVAPRTLRLSAERHDIDACTLWKMVPGYSGAATSMAQSPKTSAYGRKVGQPTPRYRIPRSRAYSFQQHSEMCVVMKRCNPAAKPRSSPAHPRQEPVAVEAFVAQAAVERLHEGVVGRFARPREVERDAVLIGPAGRASSR
jgi:hypothetical protein